MVIFFRSECSNPWNPLGPSERPSLSTIASMVLKDDNSDEEMAANRLERWQKVAKRFENQLSFGLETP